MTEFNKASNPRTASATAVSREALGLRAPGLGLRLLEGRFGAEAANLMLQLPLLRLQTRRGHGQPIMVLPGFLADDASTFVLRQYLNDIGYRAYPWLQGQNRGRLLDYLSVLGERVAALQAEHDQPVTLVGWSRGGIMAREIARDYPERVRQVVTIGSPVRGGPNASSIGNLVRRETGMTPQAMLSMLDQRQQRPITVPIKSIYSKLDGVVAWRACIDDVSPDVEHFVIQGSHIGMGMNVDVYRLLHKLLPGRD